MMFRRFRPRFALALLLLLALRFSSSSVFAQNVGGFVHAKIQNFQQTSSAAPIMDSVQPFQFGSIIMMGTATITGATLTSSGTSSPRVYTGGTNGDFSILDTFTTLAQLNAAYPSTLNVSIDTDAGTFTRSIFFFPFSYPVTPQLTVPAANWQSGMLVIDPTMDYTFTWSPFSNAQAADVIQFAIRNSGVNLSPFPATQTSYTLPAGSLQPNTNYVADLAFARGAGTSAADANIGAGYALLVKNTEFVIHTTTPALALATAASRKTHGKAGTFDIALPLSGTPGVECRTGGATGDHTIVFTFNNNIASGSASVTAGTGSTSGNAMVAANTVTVNLTGVANAQTVTVTLSNVTDTYAQMLSSIAVNASFLVGDTTGNGSVTSSDIGQTKAESGQPVSAGNFRVDVNANGAVTSSDVGLVKSGVGTMLIP